MNVPICDFCVREGKIELSKCRIGYGRNKVHICNNHKVVAKEKTDMGAEKYLDWYFTFYNENVAKFNKTFHQR
ncbi:hypothetical protein CMI37_38450 [Candidatus Pacearchaeota archaeon]|nr:hypothetical protein [Candidatus Pacearchaeota archaeon]